MKRKIYVVIFGLTFLAIVGSVFFINPSEKEEFNDAFEIDAIYYDGFVEITFDDRTKKSTMITLEILGMPESFQKNFFTHSFVERIDFPSPPVYGWKSTPITFVVEHEEFGKIGIKTEIHPLDEPSPKIIYTKNLN